MDFELFAFFATGSVFGMPWVVWWFTSRRNHKFRMKQLDVEREQELTRRRHMELDYELRQRQLTERLFDQTVDEHTDGRTGPTAVPPPGPVPRQVPPPDARRSAG